MRLLIVALSLTMTASPAGAQEADAPPAPVPADGGGEWVMLRYLYPGPNRDGIDYWISLRTYGAGPDADGIVRARWVSPSGYNAEWRPTSLADIVQDFDCINRRQRNVTNGAAGDWYTLPDFVPGSQTMFSLCEPDYILGRTREPDLATALAYSSEQERLRHAPNPYH